MGKIAHIRIERNERRAGRGEKRIVAYDKIFITLPGMDEVELPGVVGWDTHDSVQEPSSKVDLHLIATTEEVWVEPKGDAHVVDPGEIGTIPATKSGQSRRLEDEKGDGA